MCIGVHFLARGLTRLEVVKSIALACRQLLLIMSHRIFPVRPAGGEYAAVAIRATGCGLFFVLILHR